MHFAPSRFRRVFAAALAAVALLSAAARPVLACEMGRADEPAQSAAAVHDDHAHHATVNTTSDASTDGPAAPAAPQDLGCDHLVSCASMVVPTAATIAVAPMAMHDGGPHSVAAGHDAPVRALEPPPPRA